jgi:transposase
MILDNYGTHTHDNVVAWLDKHPRFHLHFIPTSSSWLNMVERWFGAAWHGHLNRPWASFGTTRSVIRW